MNPINYDKLYEEEMADYTKNLIRDKRKLKPRRFKSHTSNYTEILKMYNGEIMSSAEIKNLFGYSKTTAIVSTKLYRKGNLTKISFGFYRIESYFP